MKNQTHIDVLTSENQLKQGTVTSLLPFLKIVAKQNNLSLNRHKEMKKAMRTLMHSVINN